MSDSSEKGSKRSKIILISAYFAVWIISVAAFWFFTKGSDALGYSIVYLWFLIPITTFVISLMMGIFNCFGKLKWIFSILFGVMYMFAEYATFSASNMITFGKINMPELKMIPAGILISAAGLGIGSAISFIKHKLSNKS